MIPTDALNDALRLQRPAFPCWDNKKPACTNGHDDATSDPDKLRVLWQAHPGTLVGVPTGARSGLFVVDVDCGRHDEANDWLERWSPCLPETRQHATRSGGWHLLFKHREGLRNSVSKLAKGVDTRGEGGYIIWWPFHMGLNAPHKLDLNLAELPNELYEKLTAPARSISARAMSLARPAVGGALNAPARLRGILDTAAKAAEGERNSILHWCAHRLRDMAACGELDRGEFANARSALIQAIASTGLSTQEAQRTVASAMR
jgi:hypothetical protein